MSTLVDSNVLLDLFFDDPVWSAWSNAALIKALNAGPCIVNIIVYAESSINFATKEQFERALATLGATFEAVPEDAAFLAGKAFQAYRRDSGPRTTLLPDFLIGAHAAVRGYTLLTRDARRYRAYYPKLKLIAP
jgi:hypothetical protein